MHIPPAAKAYFDADKSDDADLTQVFSREAVVEDEGARHEGIDAIRAWWLAARRKYQHIAEPVESSGTGDEVLVRARVSGRFPNSPVNLDYFFTVKGGRIETLKIR